MNSWAEDNPNPFVIRFYYNRKMTLCGFIAQGIIHSAPFGQDIVAAGVSALVINTVHSLQELTKDKVESAMTQNYTRCLLPDLQQRNRGSREAVVLLQAFEMGIYSIRNSYGEEHITIERIER